jgi:hypothetical protein
MSAIWSGVKGIVGRCCTLGLSSLRAGFSSIHWLSWANRKKARRYSSFFKAAEIFDSRVQKKYLSLTRLP